MIFYAQTLKNNFSGKTGCHILLFRKHVLLNYAQGKLNSSGNSDKLVFMLEPSN